MIKEIQRGMILIRPWIFNWLKPKALFGGGYASTYAARVDSAEKKRDDGKQGEKNKQANANQPKGKEWKAKQRTKKLECFICGDEHYASNCPYKMKINEKNQMQDNGEETGDAFVNMAWEANIFNTTKTYQVNAVGFKGFSETEVLLDNQADILIMRPSCYVSYIQSRIACR
jgi:hypothetical protein